MPHKMLDYESSDTVTRYRMRRVTRKVKRLKMIRREMLTAEVCNEEHTF
jgi:hypothetical protein